MVDAMFYLGEILVILKEIDFFCFPSVNSNFAIFFLLNFAKFSIPHKRKKKKGQMWFFVDLKYVETHNWVKVEGDHMIIGMTHHD